MNYWDSNLTIEDWDQDGVVYFNTEVGDAFDCLEFDAISMMEALANS